MELLKSNWDIRSHIMGNTTTRGGSGGGGGGGGKAGEWKGPFSDEEFACLASRFNEAVAGQSPSAAAANLQKWLALPSPVDAPPEVTAPLEHIGASFYRVCARQAGEDGSGKSALTLRALVEAVAQCTRSSGQAVLRSLFLLFTAGDDDTSMTEQELTSLLLAALVMADPTVLQDEATASVDVAKTLAQSAVRATGQDSNARVSRDDFVRWTGTQCPLLYSIFVSWMARRCFGSLARPSYSVPSFSHKSAILSKAHLISLSTATSALQNMLDRLYTSSQDGLSFNRLCYHILGYSGPTFIVIQDTEGAVFGMFCDTQWKESSRFYGGNGCFLFRAAPDIRVYRVTASGANENYMYLNSKGYALPRGLGIGGDTNSFRLFLSEDFDENSYTTSKDLSFEAGALSSRKGFLINAMEVWGCGGEAGRQSQSAHRQETAELINRARKVDKAQFLGSDFDKEMFLSKTFGHGADRSRVADDEQH